jgi:hypothetical protein
MSYRPVADILAEWRAAERELDEASDEQVREAIEARVAALATEHRAALEEREVEAARLARPPTLATDEGSAGSAPRSQPR